MPELKSLSYKPVGTLYGDSTTESSSEFPMLQMGERSTGSGGNGMLKSNYYGGDIDMDTMGYITNDQTNKYIGSKPATTSSSGGMIGIKQGSLKLDDPTSAAYQQNQTVGDKKSTGSSVAGTIAGEAGKAVTDIMAAKANYAQDELIKDTAYWKGQGKYWFDKEQDLRPDIDKYLAEMPSATQALQEGTLTGGTASDAMKWINGPINQAVEGAITANGNSEWKGVGEYTTNKALEGAISGYATSGWVGAVVGAALNTVIGVFTWSSAVDADKKARSTARSEAEKKLKEWTINRNKRMLAQRKVAVADKDRKLAVYENKKDVEQGKKNERLLNRRDALKKAFDSAGTIAKKNRAERSARWGRGYQNAA